MSFLTAHCDLGLDAVTRHAGHPGKLIVGSRNGGRHRHTHTPALGLYCGGFPYGPCGWRTVFTWHGLGRAWVCHHYERCAVCGRVLRAELPAEDCPGFTGAAQP